MAVGSPPVPHAHGKEAMTFIQFTLYRAGSRWETNACCEEWGHSEATCKAMARDAHLATQGAALAITALVDDTRLRPVLWMRVRPTAEGG